MHAPSQGLKPSLQAMPQPAAPQVASPFVVAGQAVSQLLQCAGSASVSTQEPLQFVVPDGQSLTHLLLAHASSVAQILSQPPQLLWSLVVLTHAPGLASEAPHSAKPW